MVTADTITDEQICDLERRGVISFMLASSALGFHGGFSLVRSAARARIAEILNAREASKAVR
jgi:hypothetical protein